MSPRPPRQPGQQAVLIWPSVGNPYTYLDDLFAPGDGPRTYARAIGSYAQGILNMSKGASGGKYDNQKFDQSIAITFLLQTAAAQQANEMAFLKEKIKQIQNISGETGKELEAHLNALVSDPQNFNYVEFINIINEAILKVNNYKARLDSILHGKHHRDLERNLLTSADTLLKTYSDRRRQFAYSVEELVRLLTMRFLQENATNFVRAQINARLNGGAEHFAAAQILLQRQLGQYINDHRKDLLRKQNNFMSEEEFINLFNELSGQMEEYFDKETTDRILNDNQLLDEIIEQFGISVSKSAKVEKTTTNKKNNRQKKSKAQDKNGAYRGRQAANKAQQLLKKLGLSTELDNKDMFDGYLSRVTLNYTPDRIISFQDELQSVAVQALNGHMHPGQLINMGTDLIGITIPNVDQDKQRDSDIIAKQFTTSLKQALINEDAANNPEKTRQIYDRELDKINTMLKGLGHGFILHETNKLYTSIEGGGGFFRNSPGFSGRNMNIMNYLNSINEFGVSIGIDTAWLKFLIYNLPNGALGSGNKAQLEEILAVAAGLIMFDDFHQIAISSIESMQFSNITNIHFYKLNGVYVPCSYFLYATANTFQYEITNKINPKDAVTVEISPASVSYTRPELWEEPTNEEDWNNVRSAAEGTKIKMHFAAEFLSLISSALNAYA